MPTTATIPDVSVGAPPSVPDTLLPRAARRLLRIPLSAKLIGASVAVATSALGMAVVLSRAGADPGTVIAALAAGVFVGTLVSIQLTRIALRPVREIEHAIARLWHGDSTLRVVSSPVADDALDTIGRTLNALLDRLELDRQQMRELAAEIVHAEDREHDRISLQLRESVMQSLAALTYQITAIRSECTDEAMATRIERLRVQAGEVLDEVDVLSHTVRPRVLNDLGLVAGIRVLARDVTTPEVPVSVWLVDGHEAELRGLGRDTASALFRVTQEAVQNALRHSHAKRIDIGLTTAHNELTLRIKDNGRGFDVGEGEERRPGMGIFRMRQRVALVGGRLEIETSPGHGTAVQVTMRLGAAAVTR